MPAGAKKGHRYYGGGREKGQRNRATIERELLAERQTNEAKASGKKLAKEVLEELMGVFLGVAAPYQPLPPGMEIPGRTPNAAEFERWARLAMEAAKSLAPYQSPTFRAMMISSPGMTSDVPRIESHDNVINIDDPVAITRVYRRMLMIGKTS